MKNPKEKKPKDISAGVSQSQIAADHHKTKRKMIIIIVMVVVLVGTGLWIKSKRKPPAEVTDRPSNTKVQFPEPAPVKVFESKPISKP